MRERLLEELATRNDCYVSDLRTSLNRQTVLSQLLRMELDRYEIEELNYCLSYILQEEQRFDTREELRRTIERLAS